MLRVVHTRQDLLRCGDDIEFVGREPVDEEVSHCVVGNGPAKAIAQTVPASGRIFSWSSTGALGCLRERMLSISTNTENAIAAYT